MEVLVTLCCIAFLLFTDAGQSLIALILFLGFWALMIGGGLVLLGILAL